MSNHNAAQFHPETCGGLDNQCCECERESLSAQLAAEREKSAGLEREYLVERNLLQGAEAALSAALAAQKAAEKRAEVLAEASATLAAFARTAPGRLPDRVTLALAAVDSTLAPQAPAAEPEGSGK